jgi:hypothetical protein
MGQVRDDGWPKCSIDFPVGMEQWLVSALRAAAEENGILRKNGATEHADARDALIRGLLQEAEAWYDAEISVAQAAEEWGRGAETVRRAIRGGKLPDQRSQPRGPHRTRRGDVLELAHGKKKSYNPFADAQDIAKLRSSS